ncbi:MAG: transcriptional repressor [Verrucomicrobiota bacterium]
MKSIPQEQSAYEETISHRGHRLTPQRREVYDVLLAKRDHPTATEVFLRTKHQMPNISLATVYNCLETLVSCGLARQVNVEREATRFCANLQEHGHFVCEQCGKMHDVPLATGRHLERAFDLPKGLTVTHSEITLRGFCAACTNQSQNRKSKNS